MFSFKTYALLALSALSTVRCEDFDVIVGANGGLTYTPDSVVAQPGDKIRFIFRSKNHTATQSTFENPCVKVEGGFDSNYVPVAAGQTEFQVAELAVTSTDPIWVYCKQGTHCSAGGMVFAVNPGDRMAAFKAAATGATPSPTATSSTPGSTPTGTPKDVRVVVGGPGTIAFNPPNVQANPGDNIIFEFRQKNHAVVASSFEAPCVPLSQSTPGQVGFDSGYFPVADGVTSNFPTYTLRVNDTKPIWAFCPQGNHCGQGMVFSVNAVEGSAKSFQAFQDLAKQLNGTASTAGNGYGGNNGAFQTTISGASAAIAVIFAVAALL